MANTKILALMLMLLMVVSIIPLAIAQSETEDETEDELEEDADCTTDADCEEGYFCNSDNECEEIEEESEDETEDESEAETEDEDETEDETEDESEDETEDEDEDESDPDEEEELDEDTEEELAAIVNPYGAEVRLLQLEKSLTANILKGELIIDYILENDSEADVTELESIIEAMKDLLGEVQDALPEEGEELSGTGEELAQAFVDLKAESIELTKQFREAAREMLPEGHRGELMGKLNSFRHQNIEKLENKIKEAKQNYNAEQVASLFEALGIEEEELLQAIQDGTATKEDIKEAVKDALSEMTDDEIADAMLSSREAMSKKAVAHRAAVADAVSGIFERQSQRWEVRAEKFFNKSDEAKQNNQSVKGGIMNSLGEKAMEKSQEMLENAEQIRYRIQSRNSDEESENSGEESDDFDGPSESNSPGSAGNGNRGN